MASKKEQHQEYHAVKFPAIIAENSSPLAEMITKYFLETIIFVIFSWSFSSQMKSAFVMIAQLIASKSYFWKDVFVIILAAMVIHVFLNRVQQTVSGNKPLTISSGHHSLDTVKVLSEGVKPCPLELSEGVNRVFRTLSGDTPPPILQTPSAGHCLATHG